MQFEHSAMGTLFEFKIYADAGRENETREAAEQAFRAIDDLEQKVSTWREDSEVFGVNRDAAARPVKVSPEVIELLRTCRHINEATGGAFDPTVGPLMEVWGFSRKEGRVPSDAELTAARERVGMDKVSVDAATGTVRFLRDYMRLDFGGIGKGLALDAAAEVLRKKGVGTALLSAGTSTIVVIGTPPGETAWRVRIRNPAGGKEEEATLKDQSLSTSGGYENFLEVGAKKYCHIIDPKNGRPVEGIVSATAIAPSGAESDALSTAFFIMGVEKTREFCRDRSDVRAIMLPKASDFVPAP